MFDSSIDSIVKPLVKIVAQLNKRINSNTDIFLSNKDRIVDLKSENTEIVKDSDRAIGIRDNINSLMNSEG